MADDGFIVFVDESGDHGLESIDPASPVFVLVFCVARKSDYAATIIPALTEFKFRHFGHDQTILHERDIRKDQGDFRILRDARTKDAFLNELTEVINELPFTIIASVIRKDKLAGRYVYPANPYEIALEFGLERVHYFIQKTSGGAEAVPVIIERRGKREDNELELEFRRICDGKNWDSSKLAFEPRFVSKLANVPGLQVADLVARPIGRYVLNPNQANRAWAVIRTKLDRSQGGKIEGWGLKVFP